MGKILLSLDEIDRVKRINGIESFTALEQKTHITRKTWSKVTRTRQVSGPIIEALYSLGARPDRLLVSVENAEALAA